MVDKFKIKRILARLDDIRHDVQSMLPEPEPKPAPMAETKPESKTETGAVRKIAEPSAPLRTPAANVPRTYEPTAMDRFWAKIEDWFAVRGEFAPKGMTREFAVATRWLTRIGSVLLVGAIAYFLMLAIDKGWIGPAQRVYGMMAWGVAGSVYGVWLKTKSEKYAILGEVCAAVGLVALYLSFGLGHRYFDPPVIVSGYAAFAGLFAATLSAGALSVRLKSRMTACLALAGGFLVPAICSFTDHSVQLHLYLMLLSVGATAVAFLRGWTAYGFAAVAVAIGMGRMGSGGCEALVYYAFDVSEFALFMSMTAVASERHRTAVRPLVWLAASVVSAWCFWNASKVACWRWCWSGAEAVHFAAWSGAFAALACASRRRSWGGTPVMTVFSFVAAVLALVSASTIWWNLDFASATLLFCAFAAALVDIGARSREKTIQVLSLALVAALSATAFLAFANALGHAGRAYARCLADRVQYLWPVPALVAFAGWRLGASGMWLAGIRRAAYSVSAAMAFLVVTGESHLFGHAFLPLLRGGFVTIVWAVAASALLAAGIVRRIKISRLAGLSILGLAVFKLLMVDTERLATPGRVGVFAAVGVLLIAGAFLYLKFKSLFEEGAE